MNVCSGPNEAKPPAVPYDQSYSQLGFQCTQILNMLRDALETSRCFNTVVHIGCFITFMCFAGSCMGTA